MECLVAAPSRLQRPSGDRVKTDARDALHLARLLKLGEIVERVANDTLTNPETRPVTEAASENPSRRPLHPAT
jgi:hypothetical protein